MCLLNTSLAISAGFRFLGGSLVRVAARAVASCIRCIHSGKSRVRPGNAAERSGVSGMSSCSPSMSGSSFFVLSSFFVGSVFPGCGGSGSFAGGSGGSGMFAGTSSMRMSFTVVTSVVATVGPGFLTVTSSNSAPESSSFGGGGSFPLVHFFESSRFSQVAHVFSCPVKMSSSKSGVASGQFLPLSTEFIESSKGSGDGSGFVAGLGAGAVSFEGKSSLSAMILCALQMPLPGNTVQTRFTACTSG